MSVLFKQYYSDITNRTPDFNGELLTSCYKSGTLHSQVFTRRFIMTELHLIIAIMNKDFETFRLVHLNGGELTENTWEITVSMRNRTKDQEKKQIDKIINYILKNINPTLP